MPVVIAPPGEAAAVEHDIDALLLAELVGSKPSQAAGAVAKLTGEDRKMLYARALELK